MFDSEYVQVVSLCTVAAKVVEITIRTEGLVKAMGGGAICATAIVSLVSRSA